MQNGDAATGRQRGCNNRSALRDRIDGQMGVAIGLAFVAGLITAISPCVLPVLPIVLAGGASGGRRRPYAIIAGLVVMLPRLDPVRDLDPRPARPPGRPAAQHLHRAALRDRGDADLPAVRRLIERPLSRLSRRPSSDLGGGFLLGCALGFVFVPCGGPAIAFVTTRPRVVDFGFKTFAVAMAYTVGACHRPAGDRARRAARVGPHPRGRRAVPGRLRRHDRGGRVRARLQSRHEAADLAAGLDGRPPAAHRGEHVGPGRVLARPEPDRAEGRDVLGKRHPRLRPRARVPRHPGVDQLASR